MERAGRSDTGSITALYTVLVEGDDMTEPVADETRSILDGHIILSRHLAEANHYPAVDVLASVSRVMNNIVDEEHLQHRGADARAAREVQGDRAAHQDWRVQVRAPTRPRMKRIWKIDTINGTLTQGLYEMSSFDETVQRMRQVVDG